MKEDSRIHFHICEIFNDISDQYCVRKQQYINVLDEHVYLNEKTLGEDYI